ncbi:type IV secretory system conjugative DNA transfer family protein [Consotaella salsifontis]|uniref:Type IV secretion system protein VirD4 n=1 Tax=Consotaella salsifontis TaxID=1365950 RepID=A0A1T4TFM0_9HYPH|nr:type IV secretory system conjugative DNA transfer family protein [Consotaella salsifontis]SKA39295.1 type IV secretion system protein VirD4 [Consotaella salsifontis]
MRQSFWEKRLAVTMLVSVAIYLLLPWYVLAWLSNRNHAIGEFLNEPYRVALFNAITVAGPRPFDWLNLDVNAFWNYWAFGQGAHIALVLPPLAFAGLVWLVGFDLIASLIQKPFEPYGSARYATAGEERRYRKRSKTALIAGARSGSKFYYYDGPEHLLTVAPTRSGKGTCVIVPNLLKIDRSVVVIDPKGENAQVTARHRETFGPVFVLDPFNVSGLHNCSYNPLAGLDPDDPNFVDDAATLAAALIVTNPHSRDQHFDDAARALMRGLIMLVVAAEPEERRNLVTLREYLTYPKEKFANLLKIMASTKDADGAIASAANVHAGKNEREAAAILSTAQEQTSFLDSPQLRKTLKSSDLDFSTLKKTTASVYIVLPQSRLESHGRWIRLLVTRALQDVERTRARPNAQILFLLDEFASIGDMPVIKTAVGLMAGYGLQLWAFLQNWGQLEELYQRGAHTFAANAGVFQAFNVNDELTARYVSELSGDTTRFNTNNDFVGRKLLTPEEAMHLGNDKMFLKFKGTRPIIAHKLPYFKSRRFRGLYDTSDFH